MTRISVLLFSLIVLLTTFCHGDLFAQTATGTGSLENFKKELVIEPVFQSRVFILEGANPMLRPWC